jgi:hypothetical protein
MDPMSLDAPARFPTGVGIGKPMLLKTFSNASSISVARWTVDAGYELLGPTTVELLGGQKISMNGDFQLGISRITTGSLKLHVGRNSASTRAWKLSEQYAYAIR